MPSIEELHSNLKEAMKAGRSTEVGTLRLLITALKNRAIQKRGQSGTETLTEEEVLQTITAEAKKRKESIELYVGGGREDLAEGERAELALIKIYLPALMPEAEVLKVIDVVLARHKEVKEFGPLMKLVMAELKGKADVKQVSEIVKKKIGGR